VTPPITAPAAVEPAIIATLFFTERGRDSGARGAAGARTAPDRGAIAGRFAATVAYLTGTVRGPTHATDAWP
ncbi:MAG: hypothetical protein NUW22_05990, partial [Acidobacteria bacterium]|nr:hypothetical protein [Acidobacteriota bacterium]